MHKNVRKKISTYKRNISIERLAAVEERHKKVDL